MGGNQSSEESEGDMLRGEDGTYKMVDINSKGRPLEEFYDKYDLTTDLLGKGNYAEVRLAKEKTTGVEFAIKIMIKSNMDEDDINDMRKEVEILKHLKHRNIVKVLEYYEDNDLVYIVMEYLSGGELYKCIEDLPDFTENDTKNIIQTLVMALKYCNDRGVIHRDLKPENILLRQKVVAQPEKKPTLRELDTMKSDVTTFDGQSIKKDLNDTKRNQKKQKAKTPKTPKTPKSPKPKGPNFISAITSKVQLAKQRTGSFFDTPRLTKLGSLVSNTTRSTNLDVGETTVDKAQKRFDIVLADFGFATQVRKSDLQGLESLQTQCGTPIFVAPEIILNKGYNYKCDIWSLGVVTYMLLSGGSIPFPASNTRELYDKVLKGKWDFQPEDAWSHISKNAKDFIKRLLVSDVQKRMDYEQMLDHDWFKVDDFAGQKVEDRFSMDLKRLKQFNARRKVYKHVKTKQAALKFRKLMLDIERKSAIRGLPNHNLEKYLENCKLSDFYLKPELKTIPERIAELRQNSLIPEKVLEKTRTTRDRSNTSQTNNSRVQRELPHDIGQKKAHEMKTTHQTYMNRLQKVDDFLNEPAKPANGHAAENGNGVKQSDDVNTSGPPIPSRFKDKEKEEMKTSAHFRNLDTII